MSEYRKGRGPHFCQLPWTLQDDSRSTAYHISTYAALRRFADFGSSDGSEVSDATAARMAGCSERQLRKCRNDLKEWGWIEWEPRPGRTNTYTIHASLNDPTPAHHAEVPTPEPRHTMPGTPAHHADPTPAPCADDQEPVIPRANTEKKPPSPLAGALSVLTQEQAAPEWMHALYLEMLGNGKGPPLKLTTTRRQKYRAMFREQLADVPDPQLAFKAVLRAVQLSDFHMSKVEYRTPESLFRGPDRRDMRVQKAVEEIQRAERKTTAADRFAAAYEQRMKARSNGTG